MTNDFPNILEVRDIKVKRAGALLVDIPFLQVERGSYCPLSAPMVLERLRCFWLFPASPSLPLGKFPFGGGR